MIVKRLCFSGFNVEVLMAEGTLNTDFCPAFIVILNCVCGYITGSFGLCLGFKS